MMEFANFLSPLATIITGVAAILIAMKGWKKNAEENRKHQIFQERLRKRLEMFDHLLPVVKMINEADKSNQCDNIEKAYDAIQLYGYQDEIDKFEKFVAAVRAATQNGRKVSTAELVDIPPLLLKIRDELGYPKSSTD
ncbi:MAG: hypothetical protein WCD42_04980 [Rhizomicrobium sp.]